MDEGQIIVPTVQCLLSPEQLNLIQARITALDDSLGPMGVELYVAVLNTMTEMIHHSV